MNSHYSEYRSVFTVRYTFATGIRVSRGRPVIDDGLMIAGCASNQPGDDDPSSDPVESGRVYSGERRADLYRVSRWCLVGGVLNAKRLKDGARIEILQLPLDRPGRPGIERTQSQGRFIAMHRVFATGHIATGTRQTVTGEVTGSITLPLGETVYPYSVTDPQFR